MINTGPGIGQVLSKTDYKFNAVSRLALDADTVAHFDFFILNRIYGEDGGMRVFLFVFHVVFEHIPVDQRPVYK